MKEILIRKVREPYGWLGNMSPHPIEILYVRWPTAEHLFQALRFEQGSPIREEIRAQLGPMQAKFVAKKYADQMVVEQRSPQDVHNMRFVLMCKLTEHPALKDQLLATGSANIIEDCTNRPNVSGLFWGARQVGPFIWDGQNTLGKLWMDLRYAYQNGIFE